MQVQDSDSKSSHYYAEVCCLQHSTCIQYNDFAWYMYTYNTNTVPSIAQAAEPQLGAKSEASTRSSSGN